MMVVKMQPLEVAQAYGWKNALRDPGHERPGALAVDVDGHVWEAVGGDDYHGAKSWSVVS